MMTVHQVSQRTGVSIRTLQYYDRIGLLPPTAYSEAGYRLYDEGALEHLQQILLFRELEFSLKEIRRILQSPDFDRELALQQQIRLLTLKREHLDHLITFARGLQSTGGRNMDFTAFDTAKLDAYAKQAKEQWQDTAAYQEFSEKSKGRSKETEQGLAQGLMDIFREFGTCRDQDPGAEAPQALVQRLQGYISEHYSIPVHGRSWAPWGRCTGQAAHSPGTLTRRGARAPQALPGKPFGSSADKRSRAVWRNPQETNENHEEFIKFTQTPCIFSSNVL